MFDDPDYVRRPTRAHLYRAPLNGQEPAWIPMTSPDDRGNHRPLHGDPTRLIAAAAVLRAGDAEQIFGLRFPGEYVMTSVARLLEAIAHEIGERVDLGHDVVSAASEIAEHALAYVPRNGAQR